MRILLVGEYSRLHNSLKEGLRKMGHDVVLLSDGDGFKDFPADISVKPYFSKSFIGNLFRKACYRLLKKDIALLESGLRFWLKVRNIKDFDVVQLVNESPVRTHPALELKILKRLRAQNRKMFLLSCGIDSVTLSFMLQNPSYKSVMQPFLAGLNDKEEYRYTDHYRSKAHQRTAVFLDENADGIIASDLDYIAPNRQRRNFLGMIPNPVLVDELPYTPFPVKGSIRIFLGINRGNYHQKGIAYFEEALRIVKEKFGDRVAVMIAENQPYKDYISMYDSAHVLLDQVFAHDQGYNALEAMAKGKVVFTGAEDVFCEYYGLKEKVCINALPDAFYLAEQLGLLIENPAEISAMGYRAQAFIRKEHDGLLVTQTYLDAWAKA